MKDTMVNFIIIIYRDEFCVVMQFGSDSQKDTQGKNKTYTKMYWAVPIALTEHLILIQIIWKLVQMDVHIELGLISAAGIGSDPQVWLGKEEWMTSIATCTIQVS